MRLNIKFEIQSDAIDKSFNKFVKSYQKRNISLIDISILKTEILESINEELDEAVKEAIRIKEKQKK